MITLYIASALILICVVLCLRSKSKIFPVVGVIVAVLASLVIPPYFIKNSQEVDTKGYLTLQGISDSIENVQNQDAAQLRTLIKSGLNDNKITIRELEEIGEEYRSYRSKYSVNQ